MTNDTGAVARIVDGIKDLRDAYRLKAARFRQRGHGDAAVENDHYADVADDCLKIAEVQR